MSESLVKSNPAMMNPSMVNQGNHAIVIPSMVIPASMILNPFMLNLPMMNLSNCIVNPAGTEPGVSSRGRYTSSRSDGVPLYDDPTLPPGWVRSVVQRKTGATAGGWRDFDFNPHGSKGQHEMLQAMRGRVD